MAKQATAEKRTTDEKKDHAKLIFLTENVTQKEIANRVKVREATVSKWVREERWEDYKISLTITKEEQIKHFYNQLREINEEIASRVFPEKNYPSNSESDTITKLANAIAKMEGDVGVAEMISVIQKQLSWLRKFDLPLAQQLTPIFDAFIKDHLR